MVFSLLRKDEVPCTPTGGTEGRILIYPYEVSEAISGRSESHYSITNLARRVGETHQRASEQKDNLLVVHMETLHPLNRTQGDIS
jgi:hypothetical protein